MGSGYRNGNAYYEIKNWETYAAKIEDIPNKYDNFPYETNNSALRKKYEGRYLILIRYLPEHIKEEVGEDTKYAYATFYFKITKDDKLPQTQEEIEELEFVKIGVVYIGDREARSGEKDEYKHQYHYLYGVDFYKKKDFKELIYLGNFPLNRMPEYEFMPHDYVSCGGYCTKFCWKSHILERYEDNNLRKGYHFTEEGIKRNEKMIKTPPLDLKKMLEETHEYLREHDYERTFVNAWGVNLYDCDIAMDAKDAYDDMYSKEMSNEELQKALEEEFEGWDDEEYDWAITKMVIADLQRKKKRLTRSQKESCLEALDTSLKYWENHPWYKDRKRSMARFRKRMEEAETID